MATTVARHIGLILAFTLPAIILWAHVWFGHPASTVSCACWDSGQQVWFISWPAYALRHGLSPFFTSALWTPYGVNLLNNTSAPLTGILLSPVTWLFGPIASNSVALTVAPGLSAWSCWLACRRFVGWQPAAVLAGLLFGYSPFVVTSVALGHLSIGLLVVPPLTLVTLHEILVRQRLRPWVAGLLLGALICAQFLISVEVLAMMGIAAVVGTAVTGVLSVDRVKAALPYVVRALAAAGGVAVVLLAWPSWFLLAGPRHVAGVPFQGIQTLANGRLFHLWNAGASSVAVPIPGATSGVVIGAPGDYLGFGVLAVAVVSMIVARRRKVVWVMAAVTVACIVLSWGPTLWISATHHVSGPWLPWRTLAKLPIFRNILPVRFAIFTDLALAVLIAVGIDTARTWTLWGRLKTRVRRGTTGGPGQAMPTDAAGESRSNRTGWAFSVATIIVAAALFVPQWLTYQVPIATQRVVLPPWFSTVAPTLPSGSTVLTYPFPMSATVVSQPMVWQAVDGMHFRLAGGYAKVPGSDGRALTTGTPSSAERLLYELTTGTGPGGSDPISIVQLQSLRTAIRQWHVGWIVVTGLGPQPVEAAAVFSAVTTKAPSVSHGAWVWKVSSAEETASFSAAAALRALESCSGTLPSSSPANDGSLPQAENRCISDRLAAPNEPLG
jgi:hypothetical protein